MSRPKQCQYLISFYNLWQPVPRSAYDATCCCRHRQEWFFPATGYRCHVVYCCYSALYKGRSKIWSWGVAQMDGKIWKRREGVVIWGTHLHLLYTFNNIMMKIEINSRYEYIALAVNNIDKTLPLTHWGRTMHICVGKVTTIGSDNGLSPGRRQAIIWTIAITLLIGPLGTNFSVILIRIQTFSFKKMHLKMSSVKWLPFVSASMC